jgi:hypothetical protein
MTSSPATLDIQHAWGTFVNFSHPDSRAAAEPSQHNECRGPHISIAMAQSAQALRVRRRRPEPQITQLYNTVKLRNPNPRRRRDGDEDAYHQRWDMQICSVMSCPRRLTFAINSGPSAIV